jgi:hypothetical protein
VCTTRLAAVVVGVDNLSGRHRALGHLVHRARRKQARAQVQKLADPRFLAQEPHRMGQKSPVLSRRHRRIRHRIQQLPGGFAVGSEVVLPAQEHVIDPGDVGSADVKMGDGLGAS